MNGAQQMRKAVADKIAAGETTEQIKAFLEQQDANLKANAERAVAELNKVGGLHEAMVSMKSWIEHFGRGGTLEGM